MEAARRLWKTLGRVPDPMLRDLYLKHVAGDFGIDEATLRRHLGVSQDQRAPGRSAGAATGAATLDAPPEALELVGALMDSPAIAARRGEEISRIDLGHEGLDGTLRLLATTPPEEAVDRLRETLTSSDEGPYKRWAFERLVHPVYGTPEKAEEALNDCLRRLEVRVIESRSRMLDRQILEAERQGDTVRLEALLREKTQLRRRTTGG